MMAGDNNIVQAEKLASVYLTNKATALTTEASPPTSRVSPSSRKNTATLYATMTDVTTANAVKNSHILDANKIVITVDEPDHNTKVVVDSGPNVIAAKATAAAPTKVVLGSSGDPVIDSDGDGDLADEIIAYTLADDAQNTDALVNFTCTGTTISTCSWARDATSGAAVTGTVWQVVSVANGNSATAAVSPSITLYATAVTGHNNDDDVFTGYFSSAVNVFPISAWSTVQLESNASVISVVETGRNTGIFEAEFIVADTEGVNNGAGVKALTSTSLDDGADGTQDDGTCGTNGTTAANADSGSIVDGRFDRSGGIDADCEMMTGQFDVSGGTVAQSTAGTEITLTSGNLPAGSRIKDTDLDGVLYDEVYFSTTQTQGIAAGNVGLSIDGNLEGTAITCGGSLAGCTDGTGGAVVITVTNDGAALTNDNNDKGGFAYPMVNNVVDSVKVDTSYAADGATSNGVTAAADLKTGRVGSDTISTLGGIVAGPVTGQKTSVFITGVDRTPVVEAQANSTISVQYTDLTDNNSATTSGTKVKATATIDVDAPSPAVITPASGGSSKDRQPVFTGSASDIGSGLDVSTAILYVDVIDDDGGVDAALALGSTTGSWLGGAASIDLANEYRAYTPTLDNTTTMVDGVSSVSWTVTTSANIPCEDAANGTAANNAGLAGTHTNFAQLAGATCSAEKTTPDADLDFFSSVTDLAGNRGFSDATTTDTNDGPAYKDNYSINIDEKKPELDDANVKTGVYWNAGTTAEKTDKADRIVVAFNDEISDAPASAFQITTDAGSVLTPIAAEIGTKGTSAAGVAYDKRKNVYLTLPSALATNETPKVAVVANVTDLAGNTNKSDSTANAVDNLKPVLTLALSGGTGTGASPDDTVGLTKSAMTFTITSSEVLSGVPTVSIFAEDYGKGSTYAAIGDGTGANVDASGGAVNSGNIALATGAEMLTLDTTLAASSAVVIQITADAVIDADKDGSLIDEVTLGASTDAATVSSTDLSNLSVTAVSNETDSTVDITISLAAGATTIAEDKSIMISANHLATAAGNATTATIAEGSVTAVAQDASTFKATFDGSDTTFSDGSTKDSKAVVISASDVNSNTGTLGTRDQGASSGLYKFRLDRTAPVLNNNPDGGDVGMQTTLPRPYVIYEFTDNSKVTVVSASFGGDDVLSKLATTNSKKYFMVPDADLTAKTYAVKAKATDLAGNKGQEASFDLKVTARKNYSATILAGWNLMSFPSDPVSNSVTAVFSNSGIDQVVSYNAMAKGSPWNVATKDSATGVFTGDLETIHAGSGYWVHSDEFSSQSVALTGPEGPSASTPPSIKAIDLASGWNLIGVVDSTKDLTEADEGTAYKSNKAYLGDDGGSSVTKAFEYNTTGLSWSSISISVAADLTDDAKTVNIGEAFWVYAKPDANGLLTPIVP